MLNKKDLPAGVFFIVLSSTMVGDTGLEPVTSAMSMRRSNQLS